MGAAEVQKVRVLTGLFLPENQSVTEDQIRDAVEKARSQFEITDAEAEKLIRELEHIYTISIGIAGVLTDDRDHIPWLSNRKGEIEWKLWTRYERFLREMKHFPPQVISRLDDVTDEILHRLEDPRRPGAWDRRGMVVGQVQSGKTANYSGLINKAADAGYKVVVVLTGMDDSLRSQTQLRIDEGVIGFDSRRRMDADKTNWRRGVGLVGGAELANVHCLTSSEMSGDFKRAVAQNLGVNPGGSDPIVLVVKKNKAILENLIAWITSFHAREDDHGIPVVYETPLLVIDDECDFASVNTRNDADGDPNAINGCIRKLLRSFEKKAYVGYTATPFANIFISQNSKADERFGEDLFPKNFIVHLKKSSDYIGATKVFGLESDAAAGFDEVEALPIIREVEDFELWVPQGHKNHARVGRDLPPSLEEAILSFFLVCAARMQRGEATAHNSMLVHVTRFVSVQSEVARQIKDYVELCFERIRHEDESSPSSLMQRMRQLWEGDFRQTTAAIEESGEVWVPWNDLVDHVKPSVGKISIRMINGLTSEALNYSEHAEGLNVIAIGGSKLSRGLTLEGLSVSYYLRTSKMYDTLMQMGRWFGYRPGYLDLCRLYTTPELISWYREIALASEELLLQFDEMALVGGTPQEFGLRVRHSTLGLVITRAGAMRTAQKMKLSYSGDVTETINFELEQSKVDRNFEAAASLLASCKEHGNPAPSAFTGGRQNVFRTTHREVDSFLSSYRTHPENLRVITSIIRDYILGRVHDEPAELQNWTVAFISGPEGTVNLSGVEVGLVKRSALPESSTGSYLIKRLVNPSDEEIGLSQEDIQAALDETIRRFDEGLITTKSGERPQRSSSTILRSRRSPGEGLLLIYLINNQREPSRNPLTGFAIVFPKSARAEESAVEYYANRVVLVKEEDDE